MKAIVQHRYGAPADVLALREIDPPLAGPGQVVVRVAASTVAGDDWHLVRGLPWVARPELGLRRPKHAVPGQDVAGTVAAVGHGVTDLQAGDEVFGWCRGAWAEQVAVPADQLRPKPADVSFARAAAVPVCGFTALQGLRDAGRLQAGQKVLVIGAAGGVGTLAVQIAKALGADVTGVCSARSAELVLSLGADRVVDYTHEDFARSGPVYDVILDMIGDRSLADCRRALVQDGSLVLVGGRGGRLLMGTGRWLKALMLAPFVGHRLKPLIHADRAEDLAVLAEMLASGKLRPVIDREVPLAEAPRAVAYLERRHAQGKVIVVPAAAT